MVIISSLLITPRIYYRFEIHCPFNERKLNHIVYSKIFLLELKRPIIETKKGLKTPVSYINPYEICSR